MPADDEFRMRVDGARPRRRGGRGADGRHDLDDLGRPGGARSPTCASAPARGCTSTPPTPARRWCAPSTAGRSTGVERADSLVVNAHKWMLTPMDCSLLWTSRPDRLPRRLQPDPRVPAHARRRGRAQPERVRARARAALPLAEAVGGAALLRPRRAAADDPRARPARRRCSRAGCATSRAGSCARRGRSRVVCFRREGTDAENEAILERVNASGEIFISHTRLDGRYVLRLAIGSERTTEDDIRRAWDVLRRS